MGFFYRESVATLMSMHVFENIVRCLHYHNTAKYSKEEKLLKFKKNPFWQVLDFVEAMESQFKLMFELGQFFYIDAMCIGFRGRHVARCYNPSKPNKYHLKFFCLNDGATGYLYALYPYPGKDFDRLGEGWSATAWPIKKLCDDYVLNRNRVCATDNWYSSFEVIKYLKDHKTEHVGTIKTNRKGLPTDRLFKQSDMNKAATPRGSYRCFKKTIGNQTYYVTDWLDNKPVHMVSTYLPKLGKVERTVKVNGTWRTVTVTRPTVIRDYNYSMGGTDRMDQRNSYYLTTTKSKKWTSRIHTSILSCALCNSRILYNALNPDAKLSILLYNKLFLRNLLNYILVVNPTLSCALSPTRLPVQYAPVRIVPARPLTWAEWRDSPNIRLRGTHFPLLAVKENDRRRCVICGNKTRFVCESACGGLGSHAFLCVSVEIDNTCWYRHHYLENSRK